MHIRQILSIAGLTTLAMTASAQIAKWTFDDETLNPAIGTGTANNIGGTTYTFANGNPNTGKGWNTSTYPAQGTVSGTAGVEFMVSTVGFSGISINFDHRASGTASRWAQLDYTIDGGANWVTGFWNNSGGLSPHDTFYNFTVDLSSIPTVDNNADFGFRIVSIFSPDAFGENTTNKYGAGEVYMRANSGAVYGDVFGTGTGTYGTGGTWRFDNVTVVPEPSTYAAIVGALALLGVMARRRLRARQPAQA